MAFVNDTFTEAGGVDLALTAHTGETGATWTEHPSSTGELAVDASDDRVRATQTNTGYYQPSGTPSAADYEVSAPIFVAARDNGNELGIVARQSATTLAGYCLRHVIFTNQWVLSRISATGTHAPLGTYAQTLVVNNTYTATLRINGSVLTAIIDGTARITFTDTVIATAGRPGVMGIAAALSTSGMQLASFTATDTPALSGTTTGGSTLTGAVTGTIKISGRATASSSLAGSLAGPVAAEGTTVGTSSLTGTVELREAQRWGIHVRERPPLRTTTEAITPAGRRYRWATDDRPENAPTGERWSSTMPGGFESYDASLPRPMGGDHPDLEPFTTLRVRDAAGDIVGEYRLERTPQTSGDHIAISPGAVGYQAHLDDNKSVRALFIDRDLNRWQGPSRERQIEAAGYSPFNGPGVSPDPTSGIAALRLEVAGEIAAAAEADAYYDAGPGQTVAQIAWDAATDKNLTGGAHTFKLFNADLDHGPGYLIGDYTGDTGDHVAEPGTARRWVLFALNHNAAATADERWRQLQGLRVIGDTVAVTGTGDDQGVRASDVIRYAVQTWAPMLNLAPDSIEASGFIIPHLTFPDLTTVSEIIRQATRFGLQDWAVWEQQTFYWHSRGARGRTWRARTGPSQLQETGVDANRLWSAVTVTYQDVDGSSRTVGPPGALVDTQSASLVDPDPTNPAHALGRIAPLSMGTATPATAIEVGRRFLIEQKQLNASGSARFVGHVEDDRGVLHPYHHVRAGDSVVFVDSHDTSPRRVVRADHDKASRSCSVDLDAPPEALAALLERLAVVLVPLGL